ncbi:unnamed protein product, partial [Ectocarpus sp. 12 AP-2014]
MPNKERLLINFILHMKKKEETTQETLKLLETPVPYWSRNGGAWSQGCIHKGQKSNDYVKQATRANNRQCDMTERALPETKNTSTTAVHVVFTPFSDPRRNTSRCDDSGDQHPTKFFVKKKKWGN